MFTRKKTKKNTKKSLQNKKIVVSLKCNNNKYGRSNRDKQLKNIMKTLEIYVTNNEKVEVEVYFNSRFSGHGHYKIFCEADFFGNKRTFTKTTNDMPWIDSLSNFKEENNPTWQEETQYYLDRFESDFEDEISEWVCDLIEEDEQD